MYYSLRGKLIYKDAATAALECGGVGYKLMIPYSTAARLPELGGEVFLYTHLSVREDALDLYGFLSEAECNSFRMLTTVTGVGPKAALGVLSELSPEAFALAVITGDFKTITRAPGVGQKLAQRIALELKDKLGASAVDFATGEVLGGDARVAAGPRGEAVDALMVLGFQRAAAVAAVRGLGDLPAEELIKLALRDLSKGVRER